MYESIVQQTFAQIERAIRLLFTVGVTLNVILAIVNSVIAGFLADPYRPAAHAKLWLIFFIFFALGLLLNILCITGIHDRKVKRGRLLESFLASQGSADPKLYESLYIGTNTAVLIGILLILAFIALGVPIIILI